MSMINTFIDEDGDVFSARLDDQWAESADHTIELTVKLAGKDSEALAIEFYRYDATKIIALIAEAAAVKPVPQTPEQIAAFAHRWDARVEARWAEQTEDMGR